MAGRRESRRKGSLATWECEPREQAAGWGQGTGLGLHYCVGITPPQLSKLHLCLSR